jgi:hypothetical protein
LNNPNENEQRGAWLPDSEYWVIGREKGEEGTPHLQGYVVFMDRYRLTQIKKLNSVCGRCHWEPHSQHSTPKQASDYCKKDGDFLEHGEWYVFVSDYDDPSLQSSESESESSCSSDELDEQDDDDISGREIPLKRTLSAMPPPR